MAFIPEMRLVRETYIPKANRHNQKLKKKIVYDKCYNATHCKYIVAFIPKGRMSIFRKNDFLVSLESSSSAL